MPIKYIELIHVLKHLSRNCGKRIKTKAFFFKGIG